jgi:hypothetical protein
MAKNALHWISLLILMSFAASTVSFAQDSATIARKRFLEEQQIGRMALELEHRRNEVELLSRENDKYKEIVATCDRQIETFNALVAQYKIVASEDKAALSAFDEIAKTFRETIAAQDKRIHRLEASNRLLKKLIPLAAAVGFVLGVLGAQ